MPNEMRLDGIHVYAVGEVGLVIEPTNGAQGANLVVVVGDKRQVLALFIGEEEAGVAAYVLDNMIDQINRTISNITAAKGDTPT